MNIKEVSEWIKSLSVADRIKLHEATKKLKICPGCQNDVDGKTCWLCYESRVDLDPV